MTSLEKKRNAPKGIYMPIIVNKTVPVNIVNVGKNIQQTLELIIADELEGKCCDEGFVKPHSVKVQTFSSGMIHADSIHYQVAFKCDVCNPVEGMDINCVAKNITKAGIRAEIDETVNPLCIFISRDHHNIDDYFISVKENDNITVRVIGQRYELNDKYISIIAELLPPTAKNIKKTAKKPKLVITE